MKTPKSFIVFVVLSALLLSCSNTDDATGDAGDGSGQNTTFRTVGGTTAIGLPGSWANNCLADACGLSNADGVYRLRTPIDRSSLMQSTIPLPDGSNIVLHSRYRHDAEITSAMVNFNPTTQAMLEVWSLYHQNTPLDTCYATQVCADALMSGFTVDREAALINQWATLLQSVWPEGRNPFSDLYRAEPNPSSIDFDPLDQMHDHIHYQVDAASSELVVLDNAANELARVPFEQLVQRSNEVPIPILASDLDEAYLLPPEDLPTGNRIEIVYRTSPSLVNNPEPPVTLTVNASGSSSNPPAELIFSHQLTLATGDTYYFTGDIVTTTIDQPGTHFWAITVADGLGHSLTEGFEFRLGVDDMPDNPTFGADGSCYTPEPLTANSQNICEETLDGSETTVCQPFQSGSMNLVYSPLFCPREVQNEGALFGTCTLLASETKIFFYENPSRFNSVESFDVKQQRTAVQCTEVLMGTWSVSP